jgi:hypothetical protein
MARLGGLDEVRWYHVFAAGGPVVTALIRLGEQLRRGADPDRLAPALARAADLEMFGRRSSQHLAVELAAGPPGGRVARSAVLRATGTYALTATVCVLAAGEVVRGAVPPGAHAAGEVLDPALVGTLPGRPGVASLVRFDSSLEEAARTEEGVL